MNVWIKIDSGYRSHPKTLRLRKLLGPGAQWYPVALWLYCADSCIDGAPGEDLIEEVCGWSGKPGKLIEALKLVGFLNDDCSIHNWEARSGGDLQRMEARRDADRKRKASSDSAKVPAEFQRNSSGKPSELQRSSSGVPAEELRREDKSREDKKREEDGDPSDLSGRPADDPDRPSPKKSADPATLRRSEAIERVFAHYLTVWPKSSRYTLTPDRRSKIAARLKSFTEDELKEALTKSGTDDWPERPKYADIEKLLPNDGAVERWLNFTPKAQPVEKDPLDDGWMEWAAEQQRALHEPGPGESER